MSIKDSERFSQLLLQANNHKKNNNNNNNDNNNMIAESKSQDRSISPARKIRDNKSEGNPVKITVKVNVAGVENTKKLDIKVGEGKQTFKWLAQVIASRIQMFKLLRDQYHDEGVIVVGLRNSDGELINPVDSIFEHVGKDGLNVTAEVSSSFASDQWSYPVMNDWMLGAYTRSKSGTKWNSEISAWRERLQKVSDDVAEYGYKSKDTQSTGAYLIGEELSMSELQMAFELDWQPLKWGYTNKHFNDSEKNEICQIINKSYSIICSIFTHYCGPGKVGERFGMSLIEFKHLAHFGKIFSVNSSNVTIDQIFNNITQTSSNQTSWPLLTRSDFVNALIRLSIQLKKESITIVQSIQELIEITLTKVWIDISKYYKVYTDKDPLFRITIKDNYDQVLQTFKSWGTCDAKKGAFITPTDIIKLLVSSTIIDRDQQGICIEKILESQLKPNEAWELSELVFCEFIETVSRCAITTIDTGSSGTLSDAKKVRMALHLLCELGKKEFKSSRK